MALLASNLLKRNIGATVVPVAGAASQEVSYERSDENIVLLFDNGDALPCRIKVLNAGYGGAGAPDLDIDIAAGAQAALGVAESMYYKDPATQQVTFEILDQDNSAFSGTVADVLVTVLELPKSLTN